MSEAWDQPRRHLLTKGVGVYALTDMAGFLYRPFRNSFEAAGGSSDRFGEIEWIEIPPVDGQGIAAVGWFLHHSYHGALPNSTMIKGLGSRSRHRDRRLRERRGLAPARRASQVRQGCQCPRHG